MEEEDTKGPPLSDPKQHVLSCLFSYNEASCTFDEVKELMSQMAEAPTKALAREIATRINRRPEFGLFPDKIQRFTVYLNQDTETVLREQIKPMLTPHAHVAGETMHNGRTVLGVLQEDEEPLDEAMERAVCLEFRLNHAKRLTGLRAASTALFEAAKEVEESGWSAKRSASFVKLCKVYHETITKVDLPHFIIIWIETMGTILKGPHAKRASIFFNEPKVENGRVIWHTRVPV